MSYTVTDLTSEGSFSPAKWSGETTEGRQVFFRYRWGYLTVRFDDRTNGKTVLEVQLHDEDSNPTLSESDLIEVVEERTEIEFNHR